MDWIEQLLGVSPDNGDGTLEMAIGFAVAVAVVLAILALSPATRRALSGRAARRAGRDEHPPTG